MGTSEKKRIAVWAIQPFEKETRPGPALVEELRIWAAANSIEIQPAHVLLVPGEDVPDGEQASWVVRYMPVVEKEISSYLSGINLPGLRAPRVIALYGGTTGEAARLLVDSAEDWGAEWILVSSKGRSGLRRLALGSFAESLMLISPVPVWVFGHGNPEFLDPSRILFPTDFSDVSKRAFQRVLDQALRMGARVSLFHCVNLPQGVFAEAGLMGMTPYIPADEYVRDQAEWAKGVAAEWISEAKRRDVDVGLVIKEVVPNVSEAILVEAARERCGLIALASHSGPVVAALLGSHARQVVRQAECTVWVFGPKCELAG